MDHFFNTVPFHCHFDSPQVLILAEDSKLLFVLPYHVSEHNLVITTFDFLLQEQYKISTNFPIDYSQINDGVYYAENLYICGQRGENYFLCCFNFVNYKWTVLIDDTSDSYVFSEFVPKVNGILGFFNYANGTLKILNVTEVCSIILFRVWRKFSSFNNIFQKEYSLTETKSVNNPPTYAHRLKAFDGGEQVWVLDGLSNAKLNNISTFNTSTFTWESFQFNTDQELGRVTAMGYWSVFCRGETIVTLVPTEQGTKIYQLNKRYFT